MIELRTRWTAALVADHIRAIRASGIAPSHSFVLKYRPDIYEAAQWYCHGFRRALIAAGEDPKAIAASSRSASKGRRIKWSRAKILSTLRDRHGAGLQLNFKALKRDGLAGLCRAASREFGSYGGAIEATGFRFEAVRRIAPDRTPEAVLRSISLLGAKGKVLNVSAAQHESLNLQLIRDHYTAEYGVACRLCGGWRQAIEATGIEYAAVSLYVPRKSAQRAIKEILSTPFSIPRTRGLRACPGLRLQNRCA